MEKPVGNPYPIETKPLPGQFKQKRKLPRQGQQLPPLPFVSSTIEGRATGEVFRECGEGMLEELQDLRRKLHRHPEIGLELPSTQKAVLDALDGLPLEITLGQDLSSVTAVLRGGKRGERPVSVLLRADMDALAVKERTGSPFSSTNDYMHACGHDLHTAALVGAARVLSQYRDEISGDVIFMFQPGEEGPGGADLMIDEGVLDVAGRRPIAAYGLHVGPQDRGTFHYINGPTMASSSNLAITVYGKGGHGSRPHDAVDPVTCLAEIITSLQTAITRRFDALEPIVLTVTNLRAGDGAFNAIPDKAALGATVRVLRDEQIQAVRQVIGEITSNIAAAHRCSVEVDFEVLYPTTKTNARENQFAATVWGAQFGQDSIRQFEAPMMASEDFGAVLAQVPGSFFWLGTSNPETPYAQREWNHSPLARFDDSILGDQAAALASIAFERLATEDAHPSTITKAARTAVQTGSPSAKAGDPVKKPED
ncbi:M20 metallopeptidase family protein [Corynebacterium casei]|uniref:M20 metallopeptidase family protein n=1 Tax=Corynebacterium casei TaxID=160386 RepID=UPI0023F155D2|nr:M20 family metallopeptidase [Corynebacterium casei]